MPRNTELTGRVKSLDFSTGKVEIANKEKDFVYLPSSRMSEFCTTVILRPYVTFELDGRIVVDFKAHQYEQ